MSTISLPLPLKVRHLAPAWVAVIVATAFYCELSRLTHGQPPAELSVAMLWNLKVWTVWALATVLLATDRGRAMACKAWSRPALRWGMLVFLPSFALAFEWNIGVLLATAGWLERPDSAMNLFYRRLPLIAVALPVLAVFLHYTRAAHGGSSAPAAETSRTTPAITVSTSRGSVSIPVTQIEAIGAAENYVEIFLIDGRQILHRATLTGLCESLSAPSLVRVHRSVAVNVDHVVARLPRGRLRLQSGRVVPVGRAFRSILEEKWTSSS